MTAAGAIGGFQGAGRKTALADGRCLLVAGNAADRQFGIEQRLITDPELGGTVHTRPPAWHAEQCPDRSSSQSFSWML